jgi:hypothetical protein
MREWGAVELFSVQLPLGQEFVHQLLESVCVMTFEEMDHFMNHDIFQTGRRFLGKFEIEPNTPGIHVACTPTGLHLPYAPVGDFYPD